MTCVLGCLIYIIYRYIHCRTMSRVRGQPTWWMPSQAPKNSGEKALLWGLFNVGSWVRPTLCCLVRMVWKGHAHIPIGSMYGIYANIGGILMVNVTIYSIHGSYEIWYIKCKARSLYEKMGLSHFVPMKSATRYYQVVYQSLLKPSWPQWCLENRTGL